MKLKRFCIASILLLAAIGVYTYTFMKGDYTFDQLLPYVPAVTLPIPVWIILPGVLLFLLTLLHFGYFGISGYFREKTLQKDYKHLIDLIASHIMGEHKELPFKTERYRELSSILKQFRFSLNENPEKTENAQIDETITTLTALKMGDSPDLKPYHLGSKNPLSEKHDFNKLQKDEKFALDIFKKPDSYSEQLKVTAFEKLLGFAEEKEIKRCMSLIPLNQNLTNGIVTLFTEKKITLENEEIRDIAKSAAFGTGDYINLAKQLKGSYAPDSWIGLFEYLADHDEKAEDAFIYVLLELEMVERAGERINNAPDDAMQKFKAYLALKECDRHFPIDIFL